MKLILSSYDFKNADSRKVIEENLPKPVNESRILFIPNEKAETEEIGNGAYNRFIQKFGFREENIYVFDHENADRFRNLDIDIVYIGGGNTFGTLDKIRKCGFDRDIIDYVNSGAVYIGGSAGAYIASKNIEHVQKYDDNNVGMTDFDALGLFDGVIICHYTFERRYDFNDLSENSPYEAHLLTDFDSIVYEK